MALPTELDTVHWQIMALSALEGWQNLGQVETLLLSWVFLLLSSVITAASGYFAWRKTSGRGFRLLELSRRQAEMVTAMSFAVPILAACLQSAWVVNSGIRFYTAMLSKLLYPELWIFVTIEAFFTFVLLWFFMKVALWFRWPVLLLCLIFWTYVGFETIAVTRGSG